MLVVPWAYNWCICNKNSSCAKTWPFRGGGVPGIAVCSGGILVASWHICTSWLVGFVRMAWLGLVGRISLEQKRRVRSSGDHWAKKGFSLHSALLRSPFHTVNLFGVLSGFLRKIPSVPMNIQLLGIFRFNFSMTCLHKSKPVHAILHVTEALVQTHWICPVVHRDTCKQVLPWISLVCCTGGSKNVGATSMQTDWQPTSGG